MIDKNYGIKLVDFGLSKNLKECHSHLKSISVSLSHHSNYIYKSEHSVHVHSNNTLI